MEKEKFYIYDKYTKRFEEKEAERVIVDKYSNFDFFVHISSDGITWNVTEAISGTTICVGYSTKDEACDEARSKLSKVNHFEFVKIIKDKVEIYGISPKYLSKVLPC